MLTPARSETQSTPMWRVVICLWMAMCGLAWAEPPGRSCSSGVTGQVHCIRTAHFAFDTCQALAAFSDQAGLDRGFFTRLIWQESRFDPNARSPANALGIAQFIRSTADLRGLADPFNPADALDHAADYLADLVTRYGNIGLAAVAYNGGEGRAEGFLAGKGLAGETWDYVPIITGLGATTWRDDPPETHDLRLDPKDPFIKSCLDLASKRRITQPVTPMGDHSPWGVQITWGDTPDRAQLAFRRKAVSCPALNALGAPEYVRVKHRIPGRPTYITVRFGHPERRPADLQCRDLRRAGCVCAVYRNPG